jgi:hypothetical protein
LYSNLWATKAYGFLGGSEIKEAGAGNAALRDRKLPIVPNHQNLFVHKYAEREGLRWIQKYIRNFGGDPNKVIVWVLTGWSSEGTPSLILS